MSNGFEMCDKHTYLFATDGKDCPYCEIDRLKGELEEANKANSLLRVAGLQRDNYGEQQYQRAEDLERQLDASQALLAEANEHRHELQAANTGLRKQLAEVKVEVEALTDCLNGSRKATYTAEMYDKGVAEARQEAARSIIQIISMETVDRPFEQSQAVEIIRQRFGLEKSHE